MACLAGIGSAAKTGGNLAQPFPSVKKDALTKYAAWSRPLWELQCDEPLLPHDWARAGETSS